MFEIREWEGDKPKQVVKDEIANLGMAYVELRRLEIKEPKKTYSIFRSKEGRRKDDYCFKQIAH